MAQVIFYSQIGWRPQIWRPIACYQLARWLEGHGYTCQVIEFTHLFSPEELVEHTEMFIDESTLLIGVSSTMWINWENVNFGHKASVPENIIEALTELKQKYPKIKNVIGGQGIAQADLPRDLFNFQIQDSFGEDSLLKLLDEISKQSLATKLTRKAFSIDNHRFIYKDYDCILPGEVLPIEWGRGCIFQCPFCRDPNLGKRPGTDEKNIELMVDEFTEMYERFGTTTYYFIDETFNASTERLEALEKIYNQLPFKLEFLSYNRPDLLDKNPYTQEILHNCGQRGALMGIETFNEAAAKLIKKPWSAKRGKDFILELTEKWPNTHIDCHLIAGIPGESKEQLVETAKFLKNTNLGFFWFQPLGIHKFDQRGVFELESNKLGITWPDPQEPWNWVWDEYKYTDARMLAATLNRYLNTQNRFSMWSVGPFKTIGLEMDNIVNQTISSIKDKVGDMYEHEDRLFTLYKSKLKAIAGR